MYAKVKTTTRYGAPLRLCKCIPGACIFFEVFYFIYSVAWASRAFFTRRVGKCVLPAFGATARDANNYYEILRYINIHYMW